MEVILMSKLPSEKEALYKKIREEVEHGNDTVSHVCKKNGLENSNAYRQWLYHQRIIEEKPMVIDLKPSPHYQTTPKSIHIVLGATSLDIAYSNQEELTTILRAIKNV